MICGTNLGLRSFILKDCGFEIKNWVLVVLANLAQRLKRLEINARKFENTANFLEPLKFMKKLRCIRIRTLDDDFHLDLASLLQECTKLTYVRIFLLTEKNNVANLGLLASYASKHPKRSINFGHLYSIDSDMKPENLLLVE